MLADKVCESCGGCLVLRNKRDTTRKRFCSRSCRGKSHIFTESDMKKGRLAMVGVRKTLTPAFLEAQRNRAKFGSASHLWIDGRTPVTRIRVNRAAWRRLAAQVYERDEFKCVRCSKQRTLVAHHIEPWNGDNDTFENLVSLCRPCHGEVHHPSGL